MLICRATCGIALLINTSLFAGSGPPVTITRDGQAIMKIVAGLSSRNVVIYLDNRKKEEIDSASDLQSFLKKISGATLQIVTTAEHDQSQPAICIGLRSEFPSIEVENASALGDEGFVIKSIGPNLYLLANRPIGIQHAVTTLLTELGCRWYFPGETWTIIPRKPTIQGAWDLRQTPDYRTSRNMFYGTGAYGRTNSEYRQWRLRNKMAGPAPINIGHTWYGIKNRKELIKERPDIFAFYQGRRQRYQPCFANPEMIQVMTDYALAGARNGRTSISLSPPDGPGFCEGEECLAFLGGSDHFESHRSIFSKRPNGELANVTSETLFSAVNKVAESLETEYPDVQLGCYAYSSYAHPPTFDLHPNVFIQVTRGFRNTPLTWDEQMRAWGRRAKKLGVREYWSVYQWDYDVPALIKGRMFPDVLQASVRRFHRDYNITAMSAEAGNNWSSRGMSYYLAAALLWDVDADIDALIRDFYRQAFGPAALPIQRHFVRWLGPSAHVLDDDASSIREPGVTGVSGVTGVTEVSGVWDSHRFPETLRSLRDMFNDLDEASQRAAGHPEIIKRIDHLRMYAYYLYLRIGVIRAENAGNAPGWPKAWKIEKNDQDVTIKDNQGEIRLGEGRGPSFAVVAPADKYAGLIDSTQVFTIDTSRDLSHMMFGGAFSRRQEKAPDTHYLARFRYRVSGKRLVEIVAVVNGEEKIIADLGDGSHWLPQTKYRFKFDVNQVRPESTRLRLKYWPIDQDEPDTWHLSVDDHAPLLQNRKGSVGLFAATNANTKRYWHFDNYSMSSDQIDKEFSESWRVVEGVDSLLTEAIRKETVFGGRLTWTNMIDGRAFLGKGFIRRFGIYKKLLESTPEAHLEDRVGPIPRAVSPENQRWGWRRVGTPPDHAELNRLWAEAIHDLNKQE